MKAGFLRLVCMLCTAGWLMAQPIIPPGQIRIAFGAGNHPGAVQETWLNIIEQKPDLFVWLGSISPTPPKNSAHLRAILEKQKKNRHYEQLVRQIPVQGIWQWDVPPVSLDSVPSLYKEFAKFIGRKEISPTWYSGTLEREGIRVELLYLDTWSNLMPGDSRCDVLGVAQWNWLESRLRNTEAGLLILSGGISLHWKTKGGLSWQNYPAALRRLEKMLGSCAKPLLYVSGSHPCGALSVSEINGKKVPELHTHGLNQIRMHFGKTGGLNSVRNVFCQRNYALVDVFPEVPASLRITLVDVQNLTVWEWRAFLEDL